MARQQARRRHRERLTGITLAVLGVVVLVVAVIAIIEPKSHTQSAAGTSTAGASTAASTPVAPSSTRPKPKPTSSSARPGPSLSLGGTSPTPTPTGAAKKLPLVVLNNTSTNGLATDAAQAFRNGGWTVSEIGNLQNEIISSCAYYDPSVSGAEAAAKALQAQFPGIQRVVEKFAELPSGPVVVVLTSDYSTG